ncbi:hypothetical protein D3C73_1464640 [compost metagenome]
MDILRRFNDGSEHHQQINLEILIRNPAVEQPAEQGIKKISKLLIAAHLQASDQFFLFHFIEHKGNDLTGFHIIDPDHLVAAQDQSIIQRSQRFLIG